MRLGTGRILPVHPSERLLEPVVTCNIPLIHGLIFVKRNRKKPPAIRDKPNIT